VSEQVRDDSGLYFSPQPEGPGLAGQRHMDSALFDLRQLDQEAKETAHAGNPAAAAENQGSGLIDVKSLAGAASDAPRVPVAPSGGLLIGLAAQQQAQAEAELEVEASHARTRRRILIACCIALLAMVALLGYLATRSA
jgi:hypothetical protein